MTRKELNTWRDFGITLHLTFYQKVGIVWQWIPGLVKKKSVVNVLIDYTGHLFRNLLKEKSFRL